MIDSNRLRFTIMPHSRAPPYEVKRFLYYLATDFDIYMLPWPMLKPIIKQSWPARAHIIINEAYLNTYFYFPLNDTIISGASPKPP